MLVGTFSKDVLSARRTSQYMPAAQLKMPRTTSAQRQSSVLQHLRASGRSEERAERTHAGDDAGLTELVGGTGDNVAEEEDAVDQPQIISAAEKYACMRLAAVLVGDARGFEWRIWRVLFGSHVLTLRPPHLGCTRRKLACAVLLLLVGDVILIAAVLVTAVWCALDNANVHGSAKCHGLNEIVGENLLLPSRWLLGHYYILPRVSDALLRRVAQSTVTSPDFFLLLCAALFLPLGAAMAIRTAIRAAIRAAMRAAIRAGAIRAAARGRGAGREAAERA